MLNAEVIKRLGFATYPNETKEELEQGVNDLIERGVTTKETVEEIKQLIKEDE